MKRKTEYLSLSKELTEKIEHDLHYKSSGEIRRNPSHDIASVWRPAYVRDVEKILHSPYYNRYCDKTQVFSLYKNDDLTRRSLHVQLVSRIARNIGRILELDLDLIEAISLGHDIGHTPFGHAGEKFLSKIYHAQTSRYFCHNLHSVRVLDKIFAYNISLQTLDGILCHNGEVECDEYHPSNLKTFNEFDKNVEKCYTEKDYSVHLTPATLEGCVVRICDIIAYVGKDRQDAVKADIIPNDAVFDGGILGNFNAAIINNMIVSIIENSYGKDYIKIDKDIFAELSKSKNDNYNYIYLNNRVADINEKIIAPMFEKLYFKLLHDLKSGDKNTLVYKHHIDFVNQNRKYYGGENYLDTPPDDIVTDFIASMTDDYFVDIFEHYFPNDTTIKYKPYF